MEKMVKESIPQRKALNVSVDFAVGQRENCNFKSAIRPGNRSFKSQDLLNAQESAVVFVTPIAHKNSQFQSTMKQLVRKCSYEPISYCNINDVRPCYYQYMMAYFIIF